MGRAARRKRTGRSSPRGDRPEDARPLPHPDAIRHERLDHGLDAPAPLAGGGSAVAGHLRPLVVDSRIVGAALALVALVWFLWLIRSMLVTFLFVGVFTFVGAPGVARLTRVMPRNAAAAVVVLGAGLAIAGMFAAVVPQLVADLTEAFKALPDLVVSASAWAERSLHIKLPVQLERLSSRAAGDLVAKLLPLAEGSGDVVATGAAGVMQGALGAVGVILQIFLVPMLVFFLLTELPAVGPVVAPLVPRSAAPLVAHYLPLVHSTLSRLVRGQATVAIVMAILYVIGLSMAGVPFALAIAVLSGAAYLVPFASGAVCLVLAAAFTLLHPVGPPIPTLVGALITVVVVQLAEGYVLTPRIVGAEAGLSPLAAIVAVLVGGAAGGFLGVLFALPLAAVVALVLREETRRPGGLLAAQPEACS